MGRRPAAPSAARKLIDDPHNELPLSAASPWEITIKKGLGRDDFRVDPRLLRRALLDNGYGELAISGGHAVAVDSLPPIHKDPFDRILIAQSMLESITLLAYITRSVIQSRLESSMSLVSGHSFFFYFPHPLAEGNV